MMNGSSHKLTRLASAAGFLVVLAAFVTAAALAGGPSTVLRDSPELALQSQQLDPAIANAAHHIAPALADLRSPDNRDAAIAGRPVAQARLDMRSPDTRDAAIEARAVAQARLDMRSPDTRDAAALATIDQTLDPAIAAAIAAHRSAPTPVAVQVDASKGFDWATFGVTVAAALVGIALLAVVGLGARSRHGDTEETGTVSAA
jgi:hypothetical protein